MANNPTDLKYTDSHEWIKIAEPGVALVGITDHAQHLLGDLVYVELPELNNPVKQGVECAVVESVKAASDVYSPLDGEIIAINESLEAHPGLVNTEPYQSGWLFKIKVTNPAQLDQLLTVEQYSQQLEDA